MKRFSLVPLIVLLLTFSASAQNRKTVESTESTMVLTGAVYDINGSVIINDTLIMADGGGKKHAASTNDEGIYRIELPLGVYKIKVGAPGFCPNQVEGFKVVNATHGKMSLDFVLEVAAGQRLCKHEMIIEEKPKKKTEKKPKPIVG